MTLLARILLGPVALIWLVCLYVLIVQPVALWLIDRFRLWRAHRRLVEMTTPLGRMRVGLDSPDLLESFGKRGAAVREHPAP